MARRQITTGEFDQWRSTLSAERRAKVDGAVRHVTEAGPTLGRPRVDLTHGTQRVHKLKEVRVDRSVRLLFAFDSNANAVFLLGGDKRGQWNRWYEGAIGRAEQRYLDHERRIGKEQRCPTRRTATRRATGRGR